MGREPHLALQANTVDTLAAIIESADDAIVGKRLDGTVVSWNSGAERLFGYSAAEMVGSNILRIIPADREHEEHEILARLRRGERVTHFETQRRHRDGHLVEISLAISPIRNAMGQVVGASKVARDISELVAARAREAQARASLATRSQINQLMARSRDVPGFAREFTAVLVERGQGRAAMMLAAPPGGELTLLGAAGLPGGPEAEAQALPALRGWVRSALAHGAGCEVQPWPLAGTGPWPAQAPAAALLPFSAGHALPAGALVVFAGDVAHFDHQLLDLLDALRQDFVFGLEHLRRERQFQRVFDATDDGFLITDRRGIVQLANPAAERLLGPARGRRLAQLLDTAQGRPLRVRRSPLEEGGEQLVVIGDLSVAQALDEARAAAARAEAAQRARTELLSRVSHELRQPLTAITGYTELLQHRAMATAPTDPEPAADTSINTRNQELLARVLLSARHLNTLISDLLDMSLIEGGHLQVHAEPLDPAHALRDAVGLMALQAADAGVQLRLQLPELTAHQVQADAARLRQVLTNLVSNGIKYNRRGGQVTVSLGTEGTQAVIAVADDGLGIAAERLHELFQPFNRLGREASGIPGSGVGLALTRELVLRMDGQIDVDSRPGAGTTFRVRLPLALAAEPTPDAAGSPAGTVLCVDDDPVPRLLVQSLLSRWPAVQVLSAPDVATACAHARAQSPDVLLLDLHLEDGASGLDALAALRALPGLAAVPAILMTGSHSAADRAVALAAGADLVLSKPIEAAALLAALAPRLRPVGR